MFPFDILLKPFGSNLDSTPITSIVFHAVVAGFVLLFFFVMASILSAARTAPTHPAGWPSSASYDALVTSRQSLQAYLGDVSANISTAPMRLLTVATANFGGIFTEQPSPPYYPFIGTVDPEAARLQVEGGARAIILDIWPDPENRANPVVCAMVDTTRHAAQGWWVNNGLGRGVGRYSNWQMITRNKVSADAILNAAVTAAFNTPSSNQNGDPFFLILNLHGAMTTDYLNKLGQQVQAAIGPNGMPPEWNRNANANALATEPITSFAGRCFVIVCPDIEANYNSLPGINTYEQFVPVFLGTTLGEATNLLETTANTVLFTPNNAGAAKGLTPQGFCVTQGSIGGTSTNNDPEYNLNSFQQCTQYGVQFVGVNMLGASDKDGTLQTFFSPKFFKTRSFYFTSPPPA